MLRQTLSGGQVIRMNSASCATAQRNVLTMQLGSQPFVSDGSYEITVVKTFINNSVFNITAAQGNNTFQVSYNGVVTTATIPDGNYALTDLNGWFQNSFLAPNKLYCLASDGVTPVFFQSFAPDSVYYSCIIQSQPVAIPSGGSNPNALALGYTPLFIFNTAPFNTLIGYQAGTYPPVQQSTNYQLLSQVIPQVSPSYEYNLTCSLVNQSQFNNIPTSICQISPANTAFGNQIFYEALNMLWYPVLPGTFNSITCTLVDQANRPLSVDPAWSAVLYLRKIQS